MTVSAGGWLCLLAEPKQDSEALPFNTGFNSFPDCGGLNWVLSAGSLPKLSFHAMPGDLPMILEITHWHLSGAPISVSATVYSIICTDLT